MSCTLTIDHNAHYYSFDNGMFTELYQLIAQKHYPHRIPPGKWPDRKLIGKAMVRGWAVPCRYYPRPWRRGGYCRSFVFPGITDAEMEFIHALMRKERECLTVLQLWVA